MHSPKTIAAPRINTLADVIDRDRIIERLHQVSPDSSSQWGQMTAPQMISHLIDAFRVALGERKVKGFPTSFRRTALRWMALYSPSRRQNLRSIKVETVDQAEDFVDGFARNVRELEELVGRFLDRIAMGTLDRHPLFGPMNSWQWLRWGYIHMDHHLRQFGA
jgi:hypothetical protein